MSRLIDAEKLHYVQMLVQNPNNGKHKHMVAVRAKEINEAPTVDAIPREKIEDIKAEIENMLSDGMIHKKTVIGIIDKHMESENKDGSNN